MAHISVKKPPSRRREADGRERQSGFKMAKRAKALVPVPADDDKIGDFEAEEFPCPHQMTGEFYVRWPRVELPLSLMAH